MHVMYESLRFLIFWYYQMSSEIATFLLIL